jgi:hypothetical protein
MYEPAKLHDPRSLPLPCELVVEGKRESHPCPSSYSNCFRFTQSLARVFRLPVPVPVIALAAPSSVGNIGQFRRDKRCEQSSHSRVI